jgi:putative endonuclease
MKGFVYILKDSKERFYVGSTINIEKRLIQHQSGHTQTTAKMEQPRLVLVQEYKTLAIARIIERKIKNLKRKDYIKMMVKDGNIKIKI